MVSTARFSQLRNNLHLTPTNRQSILVKANSVIGKRQTLNGRLDLGPQFVNQVHVALPAFSPQPIDFQALYGLAQRAHVGLGMDDGNVDESPFIRIRMMGS